MNGYEFYSFLKGRACNDALRWLERNGYPDPAMAWATCEDPSWMVWLLEEIDVAEGTIRTLFHTYMWELVGLVRGNDSDEEEDSLFELVYDQAANFKWSEAVASLRDEDMEPWASEALRELVRTMASKEPQYGASMTDGCNYANEVVDLTVFNREWCRRVRNVLPDITNRVNSLATNVD